MPEKDILAIVLGGLGSSQMDDIVQTLVAQPRVFVPAVPSWSAYKVDIPALIAANPGYPNIALITHSFACLSALQIASNTWCRYMALIDPVSYEAFVSSWSMPQPPPPFDWFRRRPVGITLGFIEVPLNITGAGEPQLKDSDPVLAGRYDLHNELPHQSQLIQQVVNNLLAACPVPQLPVANGI